MPRRYTGLGRCRDVKSYHFLPWAPMCAFSTLAQTEAGVTGALLDFDFFGFFCSRSPRCALLAMTNPHKFHLKSRSGYGAFSNGDEWPHKNKIFARPSFQ